MNIQQANCNANGNHSDMLLLYNGPDFIIIAISWKKAEQTVIIISIMIAI